MGFDGMGFDGMGFDRMGFNGMGFDSLRKWRSRSDGNKPRSPPSLAAASPATGLAKRHAAEQAALIAAALGHSSRADAVAAQ